MYICIFNVLISAQVIAASVSCGMPHITSGSSNNMQSINAIKMLISTLYCFRFYGIRYRRPHYLIY